MSGQTPRPEPRHLVALPEAPPALPRLPPLVRFTLLMVGWLLFLIGVAGLVLPGIQGFVTIFFSGAVLSLASPRAHRFQWRILRRWPRLAARAERIRHWLHRRVERWTGAARPDAGAELPALPEGTGDQGDPAVAPPPPA